MATWVLKTGAVRDCIAQLREYSVHPFFPAYLYLRRLAAQEGTLRNLRPNWDELGRFLEVRNAPSSHPYFRPFTQRKGANDAEWLNPNLAGSYAPASLRAGQPPYEVVEPVRGQRGRLNLRPDHWQLAREHLLAGEQLPLIPLAGFMLRDFGFEGVDVAPDNDDLRAAFVEMFGYDDESGDEELSYLYDAKLEATPDWFEPFAGAPSP